MQSVRFLNLVGPDQLKLHQVLVFRQLPSIPILPLAFDLGATFFSMSLPGIKAGWTNERRRSRRLKRSSVSVTNSGGGFDSSMSRCCLALAFRIPVVAGEMLLAQPHPELALAARSTTRSSPIQRTCPLSVSASGPGCHAAMIRSNKKVYLTIL